MVDNLTILTCIFEYEKTQRLLCYRLIYKLIAFVYMRMRQENWGKCVTHCFSFAGQPVVFSTEKEDET